MIDGTGIWKMFLSNALRIKGALVDRDAFLRSALKGRCPQEDIALAIAGAPADVLRPQQIDALADMVILRHRRLAAGSSFVAGLPGGYALLATVPADTAQYLYQCIIVSQKLAYLYGLHSLEEEDGKRDRFLAALTIFVGVMLGVSKANEAVNTLARVLADKATKGLMADTARSVALHPVVKVISDALGVQLNKKALGKALQKAIPLAGGLLSGSITWMAFGKGARKLKKALSQAELLLEDKK